MTKPAKSGARAGAVSALGLLRLWEALGDLVIADAPHTKIAASSPAALPLHFLFLFFLSLS